MQSSSSNIIDLCKSGAPVIMGIVNVTPDSFSDGGEHYTTKDAVVYGKRLIADGAQILDIGGESTRPNANKVPIEEEQRRVLPVISALKRVGATIISIDTRNAKTMRAAIDAGANFINDVSGLRSDERSISVVAESGLSVCIMHMKGTPKTMQDCPRYDNVMDDVMAFFEERLSFCEKHGVAQNKVILDPGIGFGKTLKHNLTLIKNIKKFKRFGCPLLLGVSRKSFIEAISGEQNPKERMSGSLAAALYGLDAGVNIFRVHDVKETRQAFDIHQAIKTI